MLNLTVLQPISRWLDLLTLPKPQITEPKTRFLSRMSALLILLMGSGVVSVIVAEYLLNTRGNDPFIYVVDVTIVVMLWLQYQLSLRGQYQTSIVLFLAFTTVYIGTGAWLHNGIVGMYFLPVLVLICALFFSFSAALGLVGLHFLMLCFIGLTHPTFTLSYLVQALGSHLFFSNIIILFFTTYSQYVQANQQKELEKITRRYQIIAELGSDYAYSATISPDRELNFEWISEAFEKVTGYPPYDPITQPIKFDINHPDDREQIEHDFWRSVDTGESNSSEYRIIHKNGEVKWLSIYRMPIKDKHGKVTQVFGVARDITERKHNEENRLQQLLEREKDELLGRFVRAISQEFRTSLSIIEANRYITQRTLAPDELVKVQDRLNLIQHYINRLTMHLENLQMVYSMSIMTIERVNMEQLLNHILIEFKSGLSYPVLQVVYEPAPKLPAVLGNPAELKRAVWYLLDNAKQFTPQGTITLRTTYEPQAKEITITIEDTGIGIAPEHLPRIFDLFYKVDTESGQGGIGVGLSVVQIIAQAHHGSVHAKSILGQGSTFTLSLPAISDYLAGQTTP